MLNSSVFTCDKLSVLYKQKNNSISKSIWFKIEIIIDLTNINFFELTINKTTQLIT